MWDEFCRLINECRPAWVIAENVARLLTIPEYDGIIADLEKAGYAHKTFVLSAHDVGALHERRRVFIIAHSDCERLETCESVAGRFQQTLSRYSGESSYDCGRNRTFTNSRGITGLQTDSPAYTEREGGGHGVMLNGRLGELYPCLIGKTIHPKFVEYLMGFPEDWTNPDCKHSATVLCRDKSSPFSGQFQELREENTK